jgi:protein O-GlcNAc transferase
MGINDDEINNQARTLFFRGNELFNKDLFLEAKNYYEKALSFFPERRQILYNLSLTCYYLEDFLNASLHIKKLIEIGYKDQEIINLFVEIYLRKKELNSALDYLTKIYDQDPLIEILYGVASIHFYKKENDKCLKILDDILKKDDKFYLAYVLIGLIYADKNKLESLNYLIKSVELNKNYSQGFYLIAGTYKELGEPELAEEYYKKCYNLDTKNNNCIIEKNLILPVICSSNYQLEKYRERYDNNLNQIYNDTNISGLNTVDFPENLKFYLSYNNFDNLPIIKKKNKTFRKIFKKINYVSINSKSNYNSSSKIRIAFISEFLTDHTIGKLFQGIINNIDKKKFEVLIFHSYKTKDGFIKKALDFSNFKVITLPKDFNQKIKILENEKLDIIFYPDIGMSSDLYYLTYLRIAKVQITSWGHPETSGNETIDFFISSKLIETQNAQDHYSEELILLDNMPMYYLKPKLKFQKVDFNSIKKYACPQTLFKILPDFDNILKEILLLDKNSEIYFIKDKHLYWYKILIKRWKEASIDTNRIHFVDSMTTEEFIYFCGNFRVLLDPLYFGAGNSFYESMVFGVPTVTQPNNFMRSRLVSGAYEQMKIKNAPIVKSQKEYVDSCLKLANDRKHNFFIREQLLENSHLFLFENSKSISEFNIILEKLLQKTDAKANR